MNTQTLSLSSDSTSPNALRDNFSRIELWASNVNFELTNGSINWGQVLPTSTPTTLQGYGITDGITVIGETQDPAYAGTVGLCQFWINADPASEGVWFNAFSASWFQLTTWTSGAGAPGTMRGGQFYVDAATGTLYWTVDGVTAYYATPAGTVAL